MIIIGILGVERVQKVAREMHFLFIQLTPANPWHSIWSSKQPSVINEKRARNKFYAELVCSYIAPK